VTLVTQAKSSNNFSFHFSLLNHSSFVALLNFSIMRKASNMQRPLLAFWVPLLLLVTFCYATSVVARNDPSGL